MISYYAGLVVLLISCTSAAAQNNGAEEIELTNSTEQYQHLSLPSNLKEDSLVRFRRQSCSANSKCSAMSGVCISRNSECNGRKVKDLCVSEGSTSSRRVCHCCIPDKGEDDGDGRQDCKQRKKCVRKGGECVPSSSCSGDTEEGLCKKSCVCCFGSTGGGDCTSKKRCDKKKGKCISASDNCEGQVIEKGCKGKDCQCCVEVSEKKCKKWCKKNDGKCVKKRKKCTGEIIKKKKCKGSKCNCCVETTTTSGGDTTPAGGATTAGGGG
ncbi:unnamed protein product, partial [Meganyctiphanes norvegica]